MEGALEGANADMVMKARRPDNDLSSYRWDSAMMLFKGRRTDSH